MDLNFSEVLVWSLHRGMGSVEGDVEKKWKIVVGVDELSGFLGENGSQVTVESLWLPIALQASKYPSPVGRCRSTAK